jgi:hypothetical protein
MSDKIFETRVSKTQIRRGLRKNLPNPLSPGEFGLCTDTNEVFLGSDTSGILGGMSSRTVQVSQEINGLAIATSALNNQIIEFAVKRNVISGDGLTQAYTILDLEPNATAQYPVVTRFRQVGGTVTTLKSANSGIQPPIVLSSSTVNNGDRSGQYQLSDTSGTSRILFSDYETPLTGDTVYIVHYRRSDLLSIIEQFNISEDVAAASYETFHEVETIVTGGTGFNVGDVITVSGGTNVVEAAQITVVEQVGGAITRALVTRKGHYGTLPSLTVTFNGAQIMLSTRSVSYLVDTGQLYFDQTTGRGFFGLTNIQMTDMISLRSGTTTVGTALTGYINGRNPLNDSTLFGSGIHTIRSEVLGYVHGATVSAAGTNYAVGDRLTANSSSGTYTDPAVFEVTSVNSVSNGAITGLSLVSAGTYSLHVVRQPLSLDSWQPVEGPLARSRVSGPVNINAGGTGYALYDTIRPNVGTFVMDESAGVYIALSGTGYAVGDVVELATGTGTAAQLVITEVSGGSVLAAKYLYVGWYTVVPDFQTATVAINGSVGSGLVVRVEDTRPRLQVSSVSGGAATGISVIHPGLTFQAIAPPWTTWSPSGGSGLTVTSTDLSDSSGVQVLIDLSSTSVSDTMQDFRDSALEDAYTGLYIPDSSAGFLVHSPSYAQSMVDLLNNIYTDDAGFAPTTLAHIRSNIRLLTEHTVVEEKADRIISIPNRAELIGGTPLNTEWSTNLTFPANSTGTVIIDYTVNIDDGATFDITRIGKLSLSFPLGKWAVNSAGLAAVNDTYTEVDIAGGNVTTTFDPEQAGVSHIRFGAKVAKFVATNLHPSLPVGTPLSDDEAGALAADEYTYAHPSNQYYGFLTYANTFSQTLNMTYLSTRYSPL